MTKPVYQGSFTTGEITPELYGRVDIGRYQTSLARLRNFIVHVYGGVSRRTGTILLGEAKNAAKKCRLIPFEYNSDEDQAYAMEFGDKYIRWWLPDGIILTAGKEIYEIHLHTQKQISMISGCRALTLCGCSIPAILRIP